MKRRRPAARIEAVQDGMDTNKNSYIEFNVDETPPLHISVLYAFQIIFTNLPFSVMAVNVLHKALCGGQDYVFLAQFTSSVIFVSGLATLFQVMLGSRLPIVQGSSFSFFPPVIAMMMSPQWRCPVQIDQMVNGTAFRNDTSQGAGDEEWRSRLLEKNKKFLYHTAVRYKAGYHPGGLIAASVVQIFLGVTGLTGFLMNFIGPLTLCPTLVLIGISLTSSVTDAAKHQWGITFLVVALIIIFAVYIGHFGIPVITWNRKHGFHVTRYRLLRMFSNLIAIGICWVICHILTITGSLTDEKDKVGYLARTDAKQEAITKMQWFFFPYPGHFGIPRFSPGIFVGMLAATMASTMESIGNYHATARICRVPPPPKHAINRGIAMEGMASIFSGFIGTAHATTSYSSVIGLIGYSGVASRVPWIVMSIILMVFSVFGKLAGALATVPEPIIGGITLVGLGLVAVVGIGTLHSVDLRVARNQLTLALSIMLGLMMPAYMASDDDIINTGSQDVNQVFQILLSTGPFVACIVGLVLDNILPGTKKERGMVVNLNENHQDGQYSDGNVYNLPFCGQALRRFWVCQFIPVMPAFQGFPCSLCKSPCGKKEKENDSDLQLEEMSNLNVTSV